MDSIRVAAVGLLSLGLASCSVMSPQECQLANWREVGLTDGMAGKPMGVFEERRSACAEANVRADTQAYLVGREQGLRTYCQIGHALQVGLRGESYQGVCPPTIDPEFRRRYAIGFEVHRLREEIAGMDSRYDSLERRLHSKKAELDRHASRPGGSEEFKRLYREFETEQHRIHHEQRDIERNQLRAREQLRQAEWAMSQLR